MRKTNRIALFVLFVLDQFAGTGRPNMFASRKAIRAARSWWARAKQGSCALVEQFRNWLADGLIRLADRLVPMPRAIPILACESGTPYGWGSVDLSEPERVPAPSFDPIPEFVWDEVETAQEVKTVSVEEGLAIMDAQLGKEGKKKGRKTKAAAHTAAKPQAKRAQPKDKRDPVREAKYREVAFQVSCGAAVKTACRAVGVPESSYRTWAQKQAEQAPDHCHYCRTGEGSSCDCV